MTNLTKRIALVVATLGLTVGLGGQARAGSIRTYQETAIASGTLGGVSFTDAEIQLTSTADTDNIQSGNVLNTTYYYVPNINLTIAVTGIGTATFTDSTQTLTFPFNQAGFLDPNTGFILLTYNPVLAPYDLQGDIGPVVGTGDPFREGLPQTTLGILHITAVVPGLTFVSSAAVPEPTSLMLAGFGTVCVIAYGLARKRRAHRKATTEVEDTKGSGRHKGVRRHKEVRNRKAELIPDPLAAA